MFQHGQFSHCSGMCHPHLLGYACRSLVRRLSLSLAYPINHKGSFGPRSLINPTLLQVHHTRIHLMICILTDDQADHFVMAYDVEEGEHEGAAAPAQAASPPPQEEPYTQADATASDFEVSIDELVVEESLPAERAPVLPTAAEAAAAASLGSHGDVTCDLAPWSDLPRIGRMSVWGNSGSQYAATRCHLHRGCSVAKSRRTATNHQFLTWLFSGAMPEAGASNARLIALGSEHKEVWRRMWSISSSSALDAV